MKVYRLENIKSGFGPFTTFEDGKCLAPAVWIYSHDPPCRGSNEVREIFSKWKRRYGYDDCSTYLPDEFRFAFKTKTLLNQCLKGHTRKRYKSIFVLKVYNIDTSDDSLFLKLPDGQVIFSVKAVKVDSLFWVTPTMNRNNVFISDLAWEVLCA